MGYTERNQPTEIKPFDLLEQLTLARECTSPEKLYKIWDACLNRYDRRQVSLYQVEELKEVIYPLMTKLMDIKKSLL